MKDPKAAVVVNRLLEQVEPDDDDGFDRDEIMRHVEVRYRATFVPQKWVSRTNAWGRDSEMAVDVDPLGPTEWDVTDYLNTLTDAQRKSAIEGDSYDADNLKNDPAAPQWVQDWDDGPFEVHVQEVDD